MSLQYLSDETGHIVAVQLPIKEWEELKNKYPGIDNSNSNIPDWHKELLDARLDAIEKDPKLIKPISELIDELNK